MERVNTGRSFSPMKTLDTIFCTEIIVNILSYLEPFYDIITLESVSKYFSNVIYSDNTKQLWNHECRLICIEPKKKYSRYYDQYPYNSMYKPLAYKLLSRCFLLNIEIHCFMDELSCVLSALAIQKLIRKIH